MADPCNELRVLGLAHGAREEWPQAVARLEQAVAAGAGPEAQKELAGVRARQRAAERRAPRDESGDAGDGATSR